MDGNQQGIKVVSSDVYFGFVLTSNSCEIWKIFVLDEDPLSHFLGAIESVEAREEGSSFHHFFNLLSLARDVKSPGVFLVYLTFLYSI